MPNASVKVTLDHDIQINGQVIPAGTQELPAAQAEDVKRINDEHNKYIASLNRSKTVNAADLDRR